MDAIDYLWALALCILIAALIGYGAITTQDARRDFHEECMSEASKLGREGRVLRQGRGRTLCQVAAADGVGWVTIDVVER